MSETIQIPKGWELRKLEELVQSKKGKKPSNIFSEKKNDSLPYVDIKAFEKNIINFYGKKNDGVVCQKNDVLVVWDGARSGLVGIGINGLVGSTIVSLKCSELIFSMYLFYFLKSKYNLINTDPRGDRIPHVKPDLFWNLSIPLPSLQTQKKIVQKLDDILGQLEEKKKEIFSIIDQNKEKIDFFEKNWFSYVIDREIEQHPQRKEWKLEKLEDISELITKGSSPKWQGIRYVEHGILFITSKNIGNGKLILQKKQYVENKFNEMQKRSILKPGDLLTNIVGAGIGRSAQFDLEETANINQAVALIRLNDNIHSKFILYVLNSPKILKFMHSNKVESARPNLSLAQVGSFPVPLPPLPIQKQIVQNIKSAEEKFQSQKSQFENIKQNYENTINHINHLQPSILDAAFSGKLVQ